MIIFTHSHSATLWQQDFCFFNTFMYCCQPVVQIHLRPSDISLNTLMMNHRDNGDVSSKGVSVAPWRILMFRHENSRVYISAEQEPICSKLHIQNVMYSLKTSTLKNFEIVIAPPTGNRMFWNYICPSHCPKLGQIILKIGVMSLHTMIMAQCEDFGIL